MDGKQRAGGRLAKQLSLFDVYAISTGAMFSSGFFLLPGIAAAATGPSVIFAYLVSAFFILPAMLSVAELSTAMPRAGGAYYFLDRSLGPLVGTVGGLGTWFALVLKSAFALVGMGAYLALYVDIPIRPLAVALTALFMVVNIVGAKETGGLQRVLVVALLVVLGLFIAQGTVAILSMGPGQLARERFTPFLSSGLTGFMGTVGLVFVSYAGLTKVASVAEEVRNPDRNIPLGMFLSLLTATITYVVGVLIIVAVVEPTVLHSDLTPVATAAAEILDWLPGSLGVILIVVAAIAAFASTGNAGILSSSRYPLAMARDRLVPDWLGRIGRFQTPVTGIVVTAVLVAAVIVFLEVEALAKLASAFQLLLFALVNVAVVVMRESRIEAYDPGYRSPYYPWMQLFGVLGPLWLISEMGELAVLLTMVLIAACVGWYFYYARERVGRSGAIFHAFAQLGERRYEGLDLELRGIVKEKGLRDVDPFDEVVVRAGVLDFRTPAPFRELLEMATSMLARRTGASRQLLQDQLSKQMEAGFVPVAHGAALPHVRLPGLQRTEMLLVRSPDGVRMPVTAPTTGKAEAIHAIFFLVSPEEEPGRHLRLLGHLAAHVDQDNFLERWLGARDEQELKETLLRAERSMSVQVRSGTGSGELVDQRLADLSLPQGTLVALIRRDRETLVPRGDTRLLEGDRLTVIGDRDAIAQLAERWGGPGRE